MTAPARPSRPAAISRTQVRLHHWAAVILLLAYVSGDGVATAIQATRGWASPYPLMVPFLLLAILLMVVDRGRVSVRLVIWILSLLAFATAVLLAHLNVFRSVNLAGYGQLWVILLAMFAVQDLVAHASDGMIEAFRRSVRIFHFALAAYLAISAVVWYTIGLDLGISSLILRTPTVLSEYYGFRPSGLSREPAWAGFLLISTFIAVYVSNPRDRLPAFAALIVGIASLRSGTAFAFTVIAMAALVLQSRRHLPFGRSLLISIGGAFVLILLVGERASTVLQGADPSGLMRVESGRVAWDVIRESFPGGVGYGNFRDHAEYGQQFDRWINLDGTDTYKSDIAILNLIAEFGAPGLVIVGVLVALYWRGHHLLLWAHLAAMLFLTGGLLIPSNVLVVAVIGFRERERRLAAAQTRVVSVVPPRRVAPLRHPHVTT
ncbi:MAG: hypothetical protein CVU47_01790 [Chloroflexi bacterium HGW-Chloroflexi-9]|nr:MAG: hypothetical protein CVU47_01790 [Chloroflexi bacterium HGW-Chloroflexi-9]